MNKEQEVQECFDPDFHRGRRNEADPSVSLRTALLFGKIITQDIFRDNSPIQSENVQIHTPHKL